MKKETKKNKQTEVLKEKTIKKDLLKFVLGGNMDSGRCEAAGSKYADSIYVKKIMSSEF
ncbi:hypothetical protein PG326_10430 [Riemerella anatipestifer]|nr:hypothetical protein [Riemerella anatipestifer]MDY3358733.1 hypothetical protein [Riemerella anatipestifer]